MVSMFLIDAKVVDMLAEICLALATTATCAATNATKLSMMEDHAALLLQAK